MNLPDKPAIRHAYEQAVVALLNATNATEEDAEVFVDAMADLIFTTMQTYLSEKDINAIDHH
jgi:creatinine amidohydrolase/Fe(II)-dependent formamide hydrolase-like protein